MRSSSCYVWPQTFGVSILKSAKAMTGMIKRAAGQIAGLYRGSWCYRAVARIEIFLTLVSMPIGYVTGLQRVGALSAM
jgi:hypothetical protein